MGKSTIPLTPPRTRTRDSSVTPQAQSGKGFSVRFDKKAGLLTEYRYQGVVVLETRTCGPPGVHEAECERSRHFGGLATQSPSPRHVAGTPSTPESPMML